MNKQKLVWGVAVLLLFFLAGTRFYNHWKSDSAANQRAARINTVPVEVSAAKRGPVQAAINVTGSIQGVQEANISAKATGRIEQLLVNDGEYVRQGQLLAVIDSRELEAQYLQVKANASSAQANMANAARHYARMRALVQQGAVSQQELDAAQTQYDVAMAQTDQNSGNIQLLEAQLANTKVQAPFSGYIARKALSQGEMVSSGSVLFAVVDLSKIKIEVFVSEQDIGRVKIGQEATFTVDAYPQRNFKGTVAEISPAADLKNRAFKVKIEADNKENLLKSGMFARVSIIHNQKTGAVTVEKAAIVDKNGKPAVFVINNDQAEQRDVVIGLENDQTSEILQGLQEGETVATFGHNALKNGDKVSVTRKGGQ